MNPNHAGHMFCVLGSGLPMLSATVLSSAWLGIILQVLDLALSEPGTQARDLCPPTLVSHTEILISYAWIVSKIPEVQLAFGGRGGGG